MKKEKIFKLIHIAIIILGSIFILIPAIHSNMWFDESYSVAIADKSFIDIWKITGNDVHPALYYWMLHIANMIFGTNIIIYRVLSVLGIILLGIIGFTHIRKDFGEKTGILFSYFVYFLPIMGTYAQEIRMYSWACLIVTLMAIYAYRFYKSILNKDEKSRNKNLILFGIFSICSCYIHYYALVSAGLINLILLIYVIKNRKNDKKALIYFLVVALIQILLYIPWLIYFVTQLQHVNLGFWIEVSFINTTMQILSLQFSRNLDLGKIEATIASITSITVTIYTIYKMVKLRKESKPAILSLAIYLGVILAIAIISIKMPILYARYLLVVTGLYIFTLAFILAKEKNKIIIGLICGVVLILGIIGTAENVKVNYDTSNKEVFDYIDKEIKDDDIIIYSNVGSGFGVGGVCAAKYTQYKQYFLNLEGWGIEEAYKAYGPQMTTVRDWDFLNNYEGRIWIIMPESMELYDKIPKENINIINETKKFDTKYHNNIYNVMLVEKK